MKHIDIEPYMSFIMIQCVWFLNEFDSVICVANDKITEKSVTCACI